MDASDLNQVFWSLTTRVNAEQDVTKIDNTRIWSLDNISNIVPGMSPMYRIGTKVGIDATKPWSSSKEGNTRFDRAMPTNYESVNIEDFLT